MNLEEEIADLRVSIEELSDLDTNINEVKKAFEELEKSVMSFVRFGRLFALVLLLLVGGTWLWIWCGY